MDQKRASAGKRKPVPKEENAGAGKRKRKPKEENAGAGKRSRRRGAVGEPQQQAAGAAAVVQKVAECMQSEGEEDYAGITDESMAQMMSWLALELAAAPPLAPPAAGPGYVTVQGDVESCGPSFSGSASTVMASVDFRFVAPAPPVVGWPLPEAAPGPPEEEEQETADDDWVATLLTDGPAGEGLY